MLTHLGLVEEAGLLLEDEVCIGKGLPDRISMSSMFFFFMVEFQWFLMELSVRPGSILVISAHLFPWAVWARNRIHSSWGIHSIFRMLGFRWLCHRYRHCFPSRPSTNLAMKDQRCGPYFSTNFRTRLSSASVQGFFLRNFRDPFSDSRAESFTSSSGIYSSYVFLPIVCSCFQFKNNGEKNQTPQYYLGLVKDPGEAESRQGLHITGRRVGDQLILYSKMEKAETNYSARESHSQGHPHEPVEKVLYKLKELHEIEDQSRNEMCPVFSDEESRHQVRRASEWSQPASAHLNILKELEETDEMAGTGPSRSKADTHRSAYDYQNTEDLHLSNAKLKEDNMKLFAECIRLKKKCQSYETESSGFHKKSAPQPISTQKQEMLGAKVGELQKELQSLSFQNYKLEQKITKLSSESAKLESISYNYKEKSSECEQVCRVNSRLSAKVLVLEKQLELSESRSASKSSQSVSASCNSTTQESRKTEVDKDRLISNLRIVHESEVRKLRGVIQEMRRDSGSSRGDI